MNDNLKAETLSKAHSAERLEVLRVISATDHEYAPVHLHVICLTAHEVTVGILVLQVVVILFGDAALF